MTPDHLIDSSVTYSPSRMGSKKSESSREVFSLFPAVNALPFSFGPFNHFLLCSHPSQFPPFDSVGLSTKQKLCGSLDLSKSLALLKAALLLETEDLEAVEVRQSLSSLDLVALLGPVALLPLRVDFGLGPSLLDGAVS